MSIIEKTHPARREKLLKVITAAGDVVDIAGAAEVLDLPRTHAAKLLSRWAAQGWLRRVGTGAYVPVQLEYIGAKTVVQDPWILVPALFGPAYVAGRTAAEHWDLTEQIFRDIVVCTAQPVRKATVMSDSAVFTLKHVREELIFGTKTVWRSQTKIAVSDTHRTIVDMLDDPALGGGIQHVADCFGKYLKRDDCDPQKLIAYADTIGNGAIFKRLGFLAERYEDKAALPLVDASQSRLTQGHAKLDPSLDCRRLVTRWRLRVPETWIEAGNNDR